MVVVVVSLWRAAARAQVQLKHNKRKSEAIRKLLNTDDQPAGRGNYGGLLDGSELGDD